MDDAADHRPAVLAELRAWRTKCFAYADLFPTAVFTVTPTEPRDPAAAAGHLARHVMTQLGIDLASRIEDLQRDIEGGEQA